MIAGITNNDKYESITNIDKIKFYKTDILDFKKYPDEEIQKRFKNAFDTNLVNLSQIKYENLKKEVKLYLDILVNSTNVEIKTTRNHIRYLNISLQYLINIDKPSIFDLTEDELASNYEEYLKVLDVFINRNMKATLKRIYNTLYSKNDNRQGFKRDIWIIGETFVLSNERLNKTGTDKSIDFRSILNVENRELVKLYIEYLFSLTDLGVSSIMSTISNCKKFCDFLKEKVITNISREDILNYFEYLNCDNLSNATFNTNISRIKLFLEYLNIKNKNIIAEIYNSDFKTTHKKKKISAVDESVINQIFNILDKIPRKLSIMYLISYCTGMRVSEICGLKTNCLYIENSVFFIKFRSQKMRKEVTNPIPESLYLLIKDLIKEISNLDYEETYLFSAPTKRNYPCSTKYYTENMRQALEPFKIKCGDGTLYKYKVHDYRHSLATNMVELEIPISIIQKILHHESVEMSLSYAEVSDNHKIKKFKEFINIKGELAPLPSIRVSEDELITAEWIRQNINAQALPNGYCGMPIKLGKCPHANSCLTCDLFRTNIEHLNIHKEQLIKTEIIIKKCEENNWIPQLETNKEIKKNLLKIIEQLEKQLNNGGCSYDN